MSRLNLPEQIPSCTCTWLKFSRTIGWEGKEVWRQIQLEKIDDNCDIHSSPTRRAIKAMQEKIRNEE